jgi:hypothetical protein
MRTGRYALLALCFAVSGASPGQSFGELDINNLRARFYAHGLIGMDPSDNTPHFEAPIGSGTHSLFSAGLWIGGMSVDNQLKLAAIQYEGAGESDWYTGPLTNDGNATVDPATMAAFDHVWEVNSADVALHQAYHDCLNTPGCDAAALYPGYTPPAYFNDWPAIGDVANGYDLYLAPFNDFNDDGDYNPADGDAPCAAGDQSLFFIFNDKGGPHVHTGGQPIGLEVRTKAFAYMGPSAALANTIFVEYTMINQGTLTLHDAYLGFFTDFDLGCYSDDFVGCDVGRSMWYGYNAGDTDEDCSGLNGYGVDPPAFGATVLCGPYADYDNVDWIAQDSLAGAVTGHGSNDVVPDNERYGMSRFMSYGSGGGNTGDPSTTQHYYNYMRGMWKDGSTLTYGGDGYGGSETTRFAYPDDSDLLGVGTGEPEPAWSELSAQNAPGDRRGLGSMGPFTLEPGMYNRMIFAFTYARASGGPMASVAALQARVDSIRAFAASQDFCGGFREHPTCFTSVMGVADVYNTSPQVVIFPSPANDHVQVSLPRGTSNAELLIFDATGRLAIRDQLRTGSSEIDVRMLASGAYQLRLNTANGVFSGRFVKN